MLWFGNLDSMNFAASACWRGASDWSGVSAFARSHSRVTNVQQVIGQRYVVVFRKCPTTYAHREADICIDWPCDYQSSNACLFLELPQNTTAIAECARDRLFLTSDFYQTDAAFEWSPESTIIASFQSYIRGVRKRRLWWVARALSLSFRKLFHLRF